MTVSRGPGLSQARSEKENNKDHCREAVIMMDRVAKPRSKGNYPELRGTGRQRAEPSV